MFWDPSLADNSCNNLGIAPEVLTTATKAGLSTVSTTVNKYGVYQDDFDETSSVVGMTINTALVNTILPTSSACNN